MQARSPKVKLQADTGQVIKNISHIHICSSRVTKFYHAFTPVDTYNKFLNICVWCLCLNTETPATIDLANERPGPTPAFSGLSLCKGCLATFHVPFVVARIRGLSTDSTISPRPAMLLCPARRNMAIGPSLVREGIFSIFEAHHRISKSRNFFEPNPQSVQLAQANLESSINQLSYQRVPHHIVHPCKCKQNAIERNP